MKKSIISLILFVTLLFSGSLCLDVVSLYQNPNLINSQNGDETTTPENKNGEELNTAVWTEVSTFDELSQKINVEKSEKIYIKESFYFNAPLYVDYKCEIKSDEDVVLTRDSAYTGDLFVIGEDANGNKSVLNNKVAILTLNSLTIDGNKNVCQDVVGSILFMYNASTVNLNNKATIQNCKKTGNERAIKEDNFFMLSSAANAGGAVAIVDHANLNINDAYLLNNEVNTTSSTKTSYNGGAIYNQGTLKMYNGEISGSSAASGGAVYNYATTYLYGGKLSGNTAKTNGGAISSPNSQYANVYCLGAEISGNTAKYGGAFQQNVKAGLLIDNNSKIINNTSTESGGAIYSCGSLVVKNSLFDGNTSGYLGGAIYQFHNTSDDSISTIRFCELHKGSVFKNNKAKESASHKTTYGGAVAVHKSGIIKICGATFENSNTTSKGLNIGYVTGNEADGNGHLYIYEIFVPDVEDYSSLFTFNKNYSVFEDYTKGDN